ncbi:putative zinc finger protein [Wilcoxina mikolae CBS 423.85]|nr:putative zinc finger protein [Wilcoxina mikolae CBS 423.85]
MAYCQDCDRHFNNVAALQQHTNYSSAHQYIHECDRCDRVFNRESALNQHKAALNHWTPPYYCKECDRGFQNENNLRMHRNSQIHRGTTVVCPWCSRSFVTASGLSTHLESGACRAGINRDSVYHIIRKHDQQGVITKKLLEYPGAPRYNETIEASEQAWNGYAYECLLCQRGFGTLYGLNNHLNSPFHSQKLYHCPKRSCAREFVSLAGLVNHFESETCGVMMFNQVQNEIEGIVTGRNRITY